MERVRISVFAVALEPGRRPRTETAIVDQVWMIVICSAAGAHPSDYVRHD
jgi:hypothetical protein